MVQAAEHWQMRCLRNGMAAFWQAVHLKHIGRQILANFVSRQLYGAWNAWVDMVQVHPQPLIFPLMLVRQVHDSACLLG